MQPKALDITQIPFSKKLDIEISDKASHILKLAEKPDLLNHLGNLHAGVLFTLAESSSGEFLLQEFASLDMDIVPVIRKAEIKYSKPGNGSVYSKAELMEPGKKEVETKLMLKGKVMIKVKVDLYNEEDQRLLTALFEWFVAVNPLRS